MNCVLTVFLSCCTVCIHCGHYLAETSVQIFDMMSTGAAYRVSTTVITWPWRVCRCLTWCLQALLTVCVHYGHHLAKTSVQVFDMMSTGASHRVCPLRSSPGQDECAGVWHDVYRCFSPCVSTMVITWPRRVCRCLTWCLQVLLTVCVHYGHYLAGTSIRVFEMMSTGAAHSVCPLLSLPGRDVCAGVSCVAYRCRSCEAYQQCNRWGWRPTDRCGSGNTCRPDWRCCAI